MKKLSLILLFVLLAVGMVMGQAFIPGTDVLGAHNNGGRGCAGCHAPHSGNAGTGGETIAGGGVTPTAGLATGDYHLWATDLSIITQETLNVGGGYDNGGAGYVVNLGGATGAGVEWTASSPPVVSGIASCLSCHDGNVSKGAMMTGKSYEQAWSLLPKGGSAQNTGQQLYGTGTIPTWLGNDNGPTLGDYLNDHPVGPNANYNGLDYPQALSAYGLTYVLQPANPFQPIAWTATGAYATFVANYGAPAINSMVVDSVNKVPYVVCTTCHNQHQMNVYVSGGNTGTGLDIKVAGTYASYFFVNSPYNPGANWSPTAAPSTTQFCRQCHFGVANEAFGASIATAF